MNDLSLACLPPDGAEYGSDHLLSYPGTPHLVASRWTQNSEDSALGQWLMPWNPHNTTTCRPDALHRDGWRYHSAAPLSEEVARARTGDVEELLTTISKMANELSWDRETRAISERLVSAIELFVSRATRNHEGTKP